MVAAAEVETTEAAVATGGSFLALEVTKGAQQVGLRPLFFAHSYVVFASTSPLYDYDRDLEQTGEELDPAILFR